MFVYDPLVYHAMNAFESTFFRLVMYSADVDVLAKSLITDFPTRFPQGGWSGGAKVLGKLSVPGRSTSLDDCRARAYCACSKCGWRLFEHFFPHLSFLFSFFLSLRDGPI